MPLDPMGGKSTLVQVMAWCHQATSHCPSQCWSRPVLPYSINRVQCVKHRSDLKLQMSHNSPSWASTTMPWISISCAYSNEYWVHYNQNTSYSYIYINTQVCIDCQTFMNSLKNYCKAIHSIHWTCVELNHCQGMNDTKEKIYHCHYSDITWAQSCLKSQATRLFVHHHVQDINKQISKFCNTVSFVRRLHLWHVDSPHHGPVTAKHFSVIDHTIMYWTWARIGPMLQVSAESVLCAGWSVRAWLIC